ncbi:DUF1766-domain-containing protein [Teratosphaeria destructans]|uniref:DUF1766-domain-containing protein n=1 Tax=Teratosphaeria destructans TaxID=418781 RepID=A0A9W7W5Y7_9PEZI|nr:DUF1766-domain-containing protein [Teratosphaeria destructans]
MSNFIPQNTPEAAAALLGRSDSKNPATTCKGITSVGRPCRRAIAVTSGGGPGARRRSGQVGVGGVVKLVQEDGRLPEADFYCWQHKDQAVQGVQSDDANEKGHGPKKAKRRSTELFPLQERSSIDTLVQRLGIASDVESKGKRGSKTHAPRPPRRTSTQDHADKPGTVAPSAPHVEKYGLGRPQSKPRRPGFWQSLCCMSQTDDDYVEIIRHKRRTEQARPSYAQGAVATSPRKSSSRPTSMPVRPAPQHRSSSNAQTTKLLQLIPQHLTPQTTSALMAELIKPISAADEEGYIYIFWLTPQSKSAPAEDTARSLLSPPSSRPANSRRISDVMTEFSYDGDQDSAGVSKKTIMLKIGRANNVTRRMHEWQRQCGYALNLVRWYPHTSSSPTSSPVRPGPPRHSCSESVKKVQCVKRVERLIHIELQDKQVKRQCEACGKEHREWFEVEASQAGVRAVDECVRRWVGWADGRIRDG